MNQDEFDRLPLDDRFMILLHKKIMNKSGSAKRRSKKYLCHPKTVMACCKRNHGRSKMQRTATGA